MTRQEAQIQVRERWERLGLDCSAFPITFGQDVENCMEWAQKETANEHR